MAVDTRNKRASCLGVALFVCAVYPSPDGTLSVAADRMHMAYRYPLAEVSHVQHPVRLRDLSAVRYGASNLSAPRYGMEVLDGN